MKRYLLGLRSGDFTKNGNVWTSDAINLYNNSSYKNYSYKRSASGLNLIRRLYLCWNRGIFSVL